MNFLKVATSFFGDDDDEPREATIASAENTAKGSLEAGDDVKAEPVISSDEPKISTGNSVGEPDSVVKSPPIVEQPPSTEVDVKAKPIESDRLETSKSEIEPVDEPDVVPEVPKEPVSSMAKDEPENPTPVEAASVWGWSILKTLAEKSEEIIQDYKRDIQEFTAGLKEETVAVVDKTKHVVQDLPHSLETSAQTAAHSAQESLDLVGHSIEDFGASVWRGTTEIIAQVKEAVALVEEEAALNAKQTRSSTNASSFNTAVLSRGKYSRYEAQVSAMQRDSGTYCDEPEDTEDYAAWVANFKLDEKKGDIETILKDNAFMQELQSRIVPIIVEYDTFWTRYFYCLHKLQVAEDARADLVKRATTEQEEELTWDVDDLDETSKPEPTQQPVPAAVGSSGQGTTAAQEGDDDEGDKGAPAAAASPTRSEKGQPSASPDASRMPKRTAAATAENRMETAAAALKLEGQQGHTEEDSRSDASAASSGASTEWLVVQKEEGSPKAKEEGAGGPSGGQSNKGAGASGTGPMPAAAAGQTPEAKKISSRKEKSTVAGTAVATATTASAAPETSSSNKAALVGKEDSNKSSAEEVKNAADGATMNADAEASGQPAAPGPVAASPSTGPGTARKGTESTEEDWGEWE